MENFMIIFTKISMLSLFVVFLGYIYVLANIATSRESRLVDYLMRVLPRVTPLILISVIASVIYFIAFVQR